MIDKSTVFQEVKALGDTYIHGNKKDREQVIKDLHDLRRPKGCLYPALVHRYVVKELGFQEASKFAQGLLNQVAD
jgi:hypothetical protein